MIAVPFLLTAAVSGSANLSTREREIMAFQTCYISKQAFDRLEAGMDANSVAAVIGCSGLDTATSDEGHTQIMTWGGINGGYASAVFRNGVLTYKSQRHLR